MLTSTSPSRITVQLAYLRERRRAVDSLIRALESYQRLRLPVKPVPTGGARNPKPLSQTARWASQVAS
jgi:hypothetical protein